MSLSRRLNSNVDKKADESSADTDNVVRQLKLLSRSQTALLKVNYRNLPQCNHKVTYFFRHI